MLRDTVSPIEITPLTIAGNLRNELQACDDTWRASGMARASVRFCFFENRITQAPNQSENPYGDTVKPLVDALARLVPGQTWWGSISSDKANTTGTHPWQSTAFPGLVSVTARLSNQLRYATGIREYDGHNWDSIDVALEKGTAQIVEPTPGDLIVRGVNHGEFRHGYTSRAGVDGDPSLLPGTALEASAARSEWNFGPSWF